MAWRRIMAVGCSHGDLVHPVIREQVLEFKRRYQPEIRFDLGDLIDTACFRNGAAGTKDEARSPRDDKAAALRWIEEYEPTHIAWGNHDWRLYSLMSHPKAIIATLAGDMWRELNEAAAKVQAATVPYHVRYGWHRVGGVYWGHGYGMGGKLALFQHARSCGGRCVIAHLHRPQMIGEQTLVDSTSFCVGALADDDKLEYGHARFACLDHGHGIVYGEVSEDDAHLQLIRSANGEPLHFPVGI